MTGCYVVVSGASGSGKTTLAPGLACQLGLPLISKDTIKEAIAEVLGLGDLDWSRRLGAWRIAIPFIWTASIRPSFMERWRARFRTDHSASDRSYGWTPPSPSPSSW